MLAGTAFDVRHIRPSLDFSAIKRNTYRTREQIILNRAAGPELLHLCVRTATGAEERHGQGMYLRIEIRGDTLPKPSKVGLVIFTGVSGGEAGSGGSAGNLRM